MAFHELLKHANIGSVRYRTQRCFQVPLCQFGERLCAHTSRRFASALVVALPAARTGISLPWPMLCSTPANLLSTRPMLCSIPASFLSTMCFLMLCSTMFFFFFSCCLHCCFLFLPFRRSTWSSAMLRKRIVRFIIRFVSFGGCALTRLSHSKTYSMPDGGSQRGLRWIRTRWIWTRWIMTRWIWLRSFDSALPVLFWILLLLIHHMSVHLKPIPIPGNKSIKALQSSHK